MKEREWLSSTDPVKMLRSLKARKRDRVSERKMRLFCCACCRRLGKLLNRKKMKRAVEVAEAHADGRASDEELFEVEQEIVNSVELSDTPTNHTARGAVNSTLWLTHHMESLKRESAALAVVAQVAEATGHPDEPARQADLLRDVVGNPFRPVARDPSWLPAAELARKIYDARAFDRMPRLADALEEAGCAEAALLKHCRGGGDHVPGCWLLDLVLSKE